MNGSRTKKMRAKFEELSGLNNRDLSIYKTHWRKFKKSVRRV